MSDLISRQDAIGKIKDWMKFVGYRHIERNVMECTIQMLEELPSAEPKQKTGKWIHDGKDFPHGNDWIHCSVCGKRGINVPADLTNYCPNCGADMRGNKHETD